MSETIWNGLFEGDFKSVGTSCAFITQSILTQIHLSFLSFLFFLLSYTILCLSACPQLTHQQNHFLLLLLLFWFEVLRQLPYGLHKLIHSCAILVGPGPFDFLSIDLQLLTDPILRAPSQTMCLDQTNSLKIWYLVLLGGTFCHPQLGFRWEAWRFAMVCHRLHSSLKCKLSFCFASTLSCFFLPPSPKVKGGYVFILSVCLFVCMFVCLHAGYLEKLWTDSDEIWWACWVCDKDKLIRFWWRSKSGSGYKTCLISKLILHQWEIGPKMIHSMIF